MALIEIKQMRKSYKMGDEIVEALRGVDLTIDEGEFIAIMGPSGSGKSTLMHIIGLLDEPTSGTFLLSGLDVATQTEAELAALRAETIGFVFQQFNLLPRTTAEENVALPRLYGRVGAGEVPAKDLLGRVGLGERIGHKPNQLSGGQQQRVAIARALANAPRVLLADEPTGNLDSNSERDVMKLLTELNAQGVTVILVTHEEDVAKYAHRVVRLRDGNILADERRVLDENEAKARPAEMGVRGARKSGLTRALAYAHEATRALAANKVRSILSVLGVAIGVAAVIAMLALGAGAKASIEKQLASLGTNLLMLRPGALRSGGVAQAAGGTSKFQVEDSKDIMNRVSAIKRIATNVNGRAQVVYGDRNWNTQVLGTTITYPDVRAAMPTRGRFFTEDENKSRARVAVIGMTIVRQLFGEGEEPLGKSIRINHIAFDVIGILPEKGANGFGDQDDTIVVPLMTGMRRLFGKDHVDSFDIEVAEASKMDAASDEIQAYLREKHKLRPDQDDDFSIRNLADIQSAVQGTSNVMSMLLAAIASISLVVGGIGIMNIMLVSVTERTREIGLRKALGATNSDVLGQFLVEAVVVSLMGGLAGVTAGAAVAFGMERATGWAIVIDPNSVIVAVAFSAAVGIAFGLWPARIASKLDPITALRRE